MRRSPESRRRNTGTWWPKASRCPGQRITQNSVDYPFGEKEQKLLAQCESALATKRLICVDRVVGSEHSKTVVRLIVPEEFAHVAYGGKNLFAPLTHRFEHPDYTIVMFTDEAFESNKSKPLPQKDITIRLAMLRRWPGSQDSQELQLHR